MADTNKKYGLFLPKNKKSAVKTTNVFDDDSDDDLPGMARVNATINKEAQKSKVKRQTQLAIDQAMEQDPNVYEYDKIYDSMRNTKAETEEAAKAKKDNKPKYITNLMKAAEKRKLEQEKVQEKKIQKERETEGGEFDDKEVFVTGKYREKLQEMEKEAERERREAAMEELLDVKKQKDMSGFYRYLLNEKTGESIHNGENSEANVKTEPGTEVNTSRVKTEPESPEQRVKTEPGTEVNTSRVKTEPESPEKSATTNRAKHNSSNDSSDDSSDPEQAESRYEKGRNQSSRSPDRMKRSRSSEKRKRSRSRERRRSRSRERRRSRSPNRSHRVKDMNRSSDSKHKHSRRSRSNDRHSHKDKKHRSSSRDRISKSSKRSRSRDRKSKSKDQLSGSNEGSSKQQEDKVVSLPEKNTEEQSGKSEKATKDSESKSKYTRHTTDKTLNDAKARYLARQIAKEKARSAVNTTGDN